MKNLKTDKGRILLFAIGNSGRGDDGVGWKFAELIKGAGNNLIDIEYRYQLQIEDAAIMIDYDTVIFVDAAQTVFKGGFEIKPCVAAGHYFYSSHLQSPETILYLSKVLYNNHPEAFIVGIAGYYWDLKTTLSEEAEINLESAYNFFSTDFLPGILNHVHADSLPIE